MSYLETLNSHNTQIQNLISKANSLPDAGSSGGVGGIDTCTVIINVYSETNWSYSCTAYENGQFVPKSCNFFNGVGGNTLTLTNVVCGSAIMVLTSRASKAYSTLGDSTMQWIEFGNGNCVFSAPSTAGVTATVALNSYID